MVVVAAIDDGLSIAVPLGVAATVATAGMAGVARVAAASCTGYYMLHSAVIIYGA